MRPSEPTEGWTHRTWRSADGLNLHARDYPAAAGAARLPVICLHGLTRNARDFDALAPWIAAQGRRVLAVDVRGRGLSDRDPAADYRLPTYAGDVAAMADALGIARAVFIGTSMGGLITIELAQRASALVAAAVINDVGPILSPVGLARIGGYVGRAESFVGWDEAAGYLRRHNRQALPHYDAGDWLRMAHRTCCPDGSRVVPDYDPAIARAFAPGASDERAWADWAALTDDRPVLVLRGALSDLLAEDTARRMVANRPRARLVEIAGIGHAPMLDEPASLAAIADLLDAAG